VEDTLKCVDGLYQGGTHLFVCFDTKMLSKENERFRAFNGGQRTNSGLAQRSRFVRKVFLQGFDRSLFPSPGQRMQRNKGTVRVV
jgi:hypothetical protein